MVSATFNSDGKLTGTGAGLPLPPARQGSLGLLLQLKIALWYNNNLSIYLLNGQRTWKSRCLLSLEI